MFEPNPETGAVTLRNGRHVIYTEQPLDESDEARFSLSVEVAYALLAYDALDLCGAPLAQEVANIVSIVLDGRPLMSGSPRYKEAVTRLQDAANEVVAAYREREVSREQGRPD